MFKVFKLFYLFNFILPKIPNWFLYRYCRFEIKLYKIFSKLIYKIYHIGIGAAERTTCESGKSCIQGQCANDHLAPTGTCLYGDHYVSNVPFADLPNTVNLQTSWTSCGDAINIMLSQNMDFVFYCQNFNFGNTCCKTCSSI
jgi:hypothetical protein